MTHLKYATLLTEALLLNLFSDLNTCTLSCSYYKNGITFNVLYQTT